MAGMWDLTWTSITLEQDPVVSFVGGFTNTGMMATDFVFSISTPISPALPSTLYGGSTNVTYGDASFDGLGGLSNDTGGNPAYTGTIDGTGILNMLTSLNLTPAFPGIRRRAPVRYWAFRVRPLREVRRTARSASCTGSTCRPATRRPSTAPSRW